MNKKKIIINVSIFILIFIGIYGLLLVGIIPLKNVVRNCEDLNWDGSEHEIIREAFTGDPIIVKCNKAEETDAIIELLNTFPFSGRDIGNK